MKALDTCTVARRIVSISALNHLNSCGMGCGCYIPTSFYYRRIQYCCPSPLFAHVQGFLAHHAWFGFRESTPLSIIRVDQKVTRARPNAFTCFLVPCGIVTLCFILTKGDTTTPCVQAKALCTAPSGAPYQ
uniref:Uncharacterized protein n=1 Tax=Amphora coffeiformis TaxID=265554 RepID=A0A7S3KZW8_9STRA